MRKIILDTDIGDDIDDAFALLISITSEEFDVLGITTVFRNSLKRAKMASYIISQMGKKIPCYAGLDHPILNEVQIDPKIKAKEKLDEDGKYLIPQWLDVMSDAQVEKENAVDFIIEQIHKYPHEVTLIGIGPLTNIAIALRKDPTIIPLIKEIRIMGAGLDINFAEWNIYCDPEAAYIVFNSGVPLYAIGINVTMKTGLNNNDIQEMKESKSKPVLIIYQMMMKWFEHYNFDHPVLHDPLAVSTLIDDSLVTFKELPMQIDLNTKRGFSLVDENKAIKVNMSTDVNVEKFQKLFKDLLLKKEVN